jgi:hypothetical protein
MIMIFLADAVSVITNVGFPIFCVLALCGLVWKGFDKITSNNAEREKLLYSMLGETRAQLDEAIKINASFVEILSDLKSNMGSVQDDIVKIKQTLHMKKEG